MENIEHMPFLDLEGLKQHVKAKADELLVDITNENICFFVEEAIDIAENILENYVFAVYDQYTAGELAIKNQIQRESFTNYRMGYQQKMLEWKEKNKPEIELMEIPAAPQATSTSRWSFVSFGIGSSTAIGLVCFHHYLACLIVELLTLATSIYLYKKEQNGNKVYQQQLKQYLHYMKNKKESFVTETSNMLASWLRQGEKYSNELLTTYNL